MAHKWNLIVNYQDDTLKLELNGKTEVELGGDLPGNVGGLSFGLVLQKLLTWPALPMFFAAISKQLKELDEDELPSDVPPPSGPLPDYEAVDNEPAGGCCSK